MHRIFTISYPFVNCIVFRFFSVHLIIIEVFCSKGAFNTGTKHFFFLYKTKTVWASNELFFGFMYNYAENLLFEYGLHKHAGRSWNLWLNFKPFFHINQPIFQLFCVQFFFLISLNDLSVETIDYTWIRKKVINISNRFCFIFKKMRRFYWKTL